MRPLVLATVLSCLAISCAPAQFPTQEQNRAAIAASRNDKNERIVPAALSGMWIGDKGSVLSFGPDHSATYRKGTEGKSAKGTYKLEGHKLSLGDATLGYASLSKPDQLMLAVSREDLEHFRKFAE